MKKAALLRCKRKGSGKRLVFAAVCMMSLLPAGCGSRAADKTDIVGAKADDRAAASDENAVVDAETVAESLSDIYAEAAEENTLGRLDTTRRMVERLGGCGYTAVDMENQIDMAGAERALAFCNAVEKEEADRMSVIVFQGTGFHLYDLKTWGGHVNVDRAYYQYDRNGQPQRKNGAGYPVDLWQYTEEGYLFFEGSYSSDEDYVLTLSDVTECTALRILPLDERCRELNRKYLLPVGYGRNNIFLTDWSEEDFGSLDFYDVFDCLYPMLNGQPHSYTADGGAGTESVYEIPEDTFEGVVTAHFKIDKETLRSKTTYLAGNAAYRYTPRGLQESEYPEIPYPEVTSCMENADGTVTLFVNAVYPKENTAKSFSHKTVIRPLDGGGFQFVSNEMILPEGGYDMWWHSDRLTEEEIYAEKAEGQDLAKAAGRNPDQTEREEIKAESDLWMLPQAEHCLLTKAEQEELKEAALTAAGQAKEVYRETELTGESFYGSNIKAFTDKQRREVVSLLGRAGYVSVTDDANMENHEKVEDFYTAYCENRDVAVTLYNVERDGLLSAITFLCRGGDLQTYYVGIGWQEGGIPEVKYTSVSDIAEMKLTEKGYLIYAHASEMPHSGLRQYWRVKPLSEKCRELTEKYIYGLSYVNYNVLVTDWDSGNVEDILMPCMFEDIYRIYTGENIKPQNGRIPADTYERIMTTYFPVSVEQLRERCGYDEKNGSYAYDKIFSRQYPPFGEVVAYTENGDGTLTLTVDAVWADYNSDLAFTNTIVVQPFDDGTFRYLSNAIEEKELEVPGVAE